MLTFGQIFYLCINVGSLSSIATTEMEQRTGFWTAYLLCFCMFIVGIAVLLAGKKQYIVRPPRGSVIPNAFKAMWIGLKNKGNMGMLASHILRILASFNILTLRRRCKAILPGRVRTQVQDPVERFVRGRAQTWTHRLPGLRLLSDILGRLLPDVK